VRAGEGGVEVHEHRALFARALGDAGVVLTLLRLFCCGGRCLHLLHPFDVDGRADGLEGACLVLVVKLLHADGEGDVVHAGGDVGPGDVEGRRGAGAGVLGVDDGDAADAHVTERYLAADHLLPGDQAGCGVADDGRLQLRLVDPG